MASALGVVSILNAKCLQRKPVVTHIIIIIIIINAEMAFILCGWLLEMRETHIYRFITRTNPK